MKHSFFQECVLPTSTAQQRRHTKTGKTYLTNKQKNAFAFFRSIFRLNKPPEVLKPPIRLYCSLTWPHIKANRTKGDIIPKVTVPDWDNLGKFICDAMAAEQWFSNDAQIFSGTIEKFRGPMPGIAVEIESEVVYEQ